MATPMLVLGCSDITINQLRFRTEPPLSSAGHECAPSTLPMLWGIFHSRSFRVWDPSGPVSPVHPISIEHRYSVKPYNEKSMCRTSACFYVKPLVFMKTELWRGQHSSRCGRVARRRRRACLSDLKRGFVIRWLFICCAHEDNRLTCLFWRQAIASRLLSTLCLATYVYLPMSTCSIWTGILPLSV